MLQGSLWPKMRWRRVDVSGHRVQLPLGFDALVFYGRGLPGAESACPMPLRWHRFPLFSRRLRERACCLASTPPGHPTLSSAVLSAAVQAVDARRWCWLLPDPPLAWAFPHERKADFCGTRLNWWHEFSCPKFSQSARERLVQYEAPKTCATPAAGWADDPPRVAAIGYLGCSTCRLCPRLPSGAVLEWHTALGDAAIMPAADKFPTGRWPTMPDCQPRRRP